MSPEPVRVRLRVNGEDHRVEVEARTTLAELLRDGLGLTGTKLACEHGVCGSCTVVVDGAAVRSCLLLAAQCEGAGVTTVEGLAAGPARHPLQEAFAAEHGLQCGFCTPGWLLLLAAALEEDPDLDRDEARFEDLLGSNLCRCTGYEGIRRAARRGAEALRRQAADRPAT